MSLVGTFRELAVALDEIKSLRSQISSVKTSHDELRQRITVLEQKELVRDIEFGHLTERTKSAADAGVSIGLARMEGDLKVKLVELDLRLQAVERGSEKKRSPKKLPRP